MDAPYILDLLDTEFLKTLKGSASIPILKMRMNKLILFRYTCIIRALSILNQDDNLYKKSLSIIQSYLHKTHQSFNLPEVTPIHIDIESLLESRIAFCQSEINRLDDYKDKLAYKSQLCIACKMNPSSYVAIPCHHASYCDLCMSKINFRPSSVCYCCNQQIVEIVPLQAINMDTNQIVSNSHTKVKFQ